MIKKMVSSDVRKREENKSTNNSEVHSTVYKSCFRLCSGVWLVVVKKTSPLEICKCDHSEKMLGRYSERKKVSSINTTIS